MYYRMSPNIRIQTTGIKWELSFHKHNSILKLNFILNYMIVYKKRNCGIQHGFSFFAFTCPSLIGTVKNNFHAK